jgi:hypothetical protein
MTNPTCPRIAKTGGVSSGQQVSHRVIRRKGDDVGCRIVGGANDRLDGLDRAGVPGLALEPVRRCHADLAADPDDRLEGPSTLVRGALLAARAPVQNDARRLGQCAPVVANSERRAVHVLRVGDEIVRAAPRRDEHHAARGTQVPRIDPDLGGHLASFMS